MRSITLAVLLLFMISNTFGQEEQNSEILYMVAETLNGEKQSPINIPGFVVKTKAINIERDYLSSKISISNTNQNIRFNYDFGSSLILNDQLYDLKYIQFKTPSEHLISSITYPLEMQIVHLLRKSAGMENSYIIVTILFQEGRENAMLQNLINNIPTEGDTFSDDDLTFYIDDFFTGKNNYYFYEGSLTSPQYSETVSWFVKTDIQEASYAQIKKINVLQNNNARHIQALNGREIIVNSGL